jgi:2'-5' RNA ligase
VIAERLRRLTRRRPGAASAVVVPVPEAGRTVPSWTLAMEPHVTVLYPFVPAQRIDDALVAALRDVLGAVPAFEFALAEVRRFPGVLYLAPEPAAPFVAMTEACARRWPEHPPYEGAYAGVVPHVTLAEGQEPPGLAERAAGALPIRARAREAWLMAPGAGGAWERRAALPLSGA